MYKRCAGMLILAGLVALGATGARADLFEDSLAALTNNKLDAARWDRYGDTLRGGLATGYPDPPTGNPLLNDFNLSTSCGSFSFGAGLIDNLSGMLDPDVLVGSLVQGLQDSVQNLIGAAIGQLSMLSACYAVPTLCDVTKHLQALTNEIFQGKSLSCQQAEEMLVGVGARLTGARTSRCISAQQRAGKTLAEAEEACNSSSSGGIYHARTGAEVPAGSSTDLIRDTVMRAQDNQNSLGGGDPDTDADMQAMQDFAEELLGKVEVKPGATDEEPLDVDITPPSKRLHDIYKTWRDQLSAKIDDAVDIVGAGNTLTSDKHTDVSLPGLAMPYGVLESLWNMEQTDPQAYEEYRAKLAGNFTMLKLYWRSDELRDLLEEGMQDNTKLSEAEADIIQARLDRLLRERDRFISEKELMERHAVPILQAILDENRERDDAAGAALVSVGHGTSTAASRFGVQLPLGYGY